MINANFGFSMKYGRQRVKRYFAAEPTPFANQTGSKFFLKLMLGGTTVDLIHVTACMQDFSLATEIALEWERRGMCPLDIGCR